MLALITPLLYLIHLVPCLILASPLSSATIRNPRKEHFVVNLQSRHHKPGAPVAHDSTEIRVFDPTYALKEIKGIRQKYEQASRYLLGKGVNPAMDIDLANFYPENIPMNVINSVSTSLPDIEISNVQPSIPGANAGWSLQPLKDHITGTQDISYYGPLQLGTPPQILNFDIDTGSSDLWVPVNCTHCVNREFLSKHSSTFRNTKNSFSIEYGTGKVSGTLASDFVSVGSSDLRVQTYFGAVSEVSDDLNDSPSSGIHGMAFGSISSSGKPTFFENLIAAGKLESPLFSVHTTRNQESGSQACFGCYDASKAIGTVTWLPVISKTYWTVQLDGLNATGIANVETHLNAVIDTGTSLIYVPSDVAAQFYAQIPGAKAAARYGPSFFTFPCSSKLEISLFMGGKAFAVNMYDFNLGKMSPSSSDCIGGILAVEDGFPASMAIIGDEFLKSWYSTYDYGHGSRVGLSPSVNNKL